MKYKQVYFKDGEIVVKLMYENDSERWFGENLLSEFKSFVSITGGFTMSEKEYSEIRRQVIELQRNILKKRGINSVSINKKEPNIARDILFLN
jgi:hypothetical protein